MRMNYRIPLLLAGLAALAALRASLAALACDFDKARRVSGVHSCLQPHSAKGLRGNGAPYFCCEVIELRLLE